MAIDQYALMEAILSLDAYNEGGAVGMALPNNVVAGGATVVWNSYQLLEGDQGIDPTQYSFYATEYDWNGQTTIAYRGTMMPGGGIDGGDMFYGWPLGVGDDTAMQATLAVDFYQDVVSSQAAYPPPNEASQENWQTGNIEVTGHSLGVLLDAEGKPWLIEAQRKPALAGSPLVNKINSRMFGTIFEMSCAYVIDDGMTAEEFGALMKEPVALAKREGEREMGNRGMFEGLAG